MPKRYTRRGGAPDLPRLLTVKEFADLLSRSADRRYSEMWVREAINDGRIPAAQLVGGYMWVIPEDALIRPRYVPFSNKMLDELLPPHVTEGAEPYFIPDRRPRGRKPGQVAGGKKSVHIPSLKRLRLERGWSRRELCRRAGGMSHYTIERAEAGKKVTVPTLLRLAEALGVDYEDLMREDPERRYV